MSGTPQDVTPENGQSTPNGSQKAASAKGQAINMVSKRRKARTLALQALYQWHMSGNSITSVEAEFLADNDLNKVDVPYFRELLKQIPASLSELDAEIAPLMDRAVDSLDPIEKMLVRMGTYELKQRVDVPYRVVINEAVDLAKKFGGTDGHKFVNGILDRLAPRIRRHETRK